MLYESSILLVSLSKNLNVPNLLTVMRILLLPVLVYAFFCQSRFGNILAFAVFIISSVTDYVDGIYARKTQQVTKFGQFLDPLADKLLISITIVLIIGFNRIEQYNIIAVIIILIRELIVSDLRNIAHTNSVQIKTSAISKAKTFFQMCAFCTILFNQIFVYEYMVICSEILLWISALLSIVSGICYFIKYGFMFF